MEKENLGSGWKQVLAFDKNVRDCENRILEIIAHPTAGLGQEMKRLQAIITLNKNFAEATFMDLVTYDIDILIDLVERNLLDSEGR